MHCILLMDAFESLRYAVKCLCNGIQFWASAVELMSLFPPATDVLEIIHKHLDRRELHASLWCICCVTSVCGVSGHASRQNRPSSLLSSRCITGSPSTRVWPAPHPTSVQKSCQGASGRACARPPDRRPAAVVDADSDRARGRGPATKLGETPAGGTRSRPLLRDPQTPPNAGPLL